MKRLEFRLSMPGRSSWDGGWSGAGRNYAIVRTLDDAKAAEVMADAPYYHRWDDGWAASIDVRQLKPGERAKKSDGFAGYDWMVNNIIWYGSPYTTGTTEGQTPAGFKR